MYFVLKNRWFNLINQMMMVQFNQPNDILLLPKAKKILVHLRFETIHRFVDFPRKLTHNVVVSFQNDNKAIIEMDSGLLLSVTKI